MSRLLIAASGTGGHIFPALVVADALPKSWTITWLGVPDRLEVDLVSETYSLKTIAVGGLQSKGFQKFIQVWKLLASVFSVYSLLKRKRIEVVFTTGGYIAVPAIISAKLSGIPVLLHESNAFPGKASRFFGWLCDCVALGSPDSMDYLQWCKKTFTGVPVRKEVFSQQSLPKWAPSGTSPLIVVIGGSQGAVMLNRMVTSISTAILEKGFRLIHLIGKNDPLTEEYYQNVNNKNLVAKSFTDEIPALLQHADLVISRSGASALSEFAVTSVPAILIPFPSATDNHQELNAVYAARYGAAVIVHQDNEFPESLLNTVLNLFERELTGYQITIDPLTFMSKGMQKIAVKDAEFKIIKVLESLLD